MTFLTRSALYVPGDHDRAMAKACERGADMLIFDLEDGVAPERKAYARERIISFLNHPRFRGNDMVKLIRINHRSTPYYADDLAALVVAPFDGLMLSKVAAPDDVDHAAERLARAHRADLPIWCNVETPQGITHADAILAHPRVAGVVAGTNDLANDLGIRRTPDRSGLLYALQRLVCAARANGKIALDGTFIDLNDSEGLRAEAEQGRMLGFDGKTLIHPKQIAIANEIFGITDEDIAHAEAVITAYEAAMAENKAVTLLHGEMIERLHYDRAQKLLASGGPGGIG